MNVGNILTKKGAQPVTLTESASVADALALLYQHNIGALIVVERSGAVTGIISERDIVRRLHDTGTEVLNHPVAACMTAKPFHCTPQATVADVMQTMTTKRVRHMPVLEQGRLVGVISIGDVVKRKIEEAEEEAEALREYIAS